MILTTVLGMALAGVAAAAEPARLQASIAPACWRLSDVGFVAGELELSWRVTARLRLLVSASQAATLVELDEALCGTDRARCMSWNTVAPLRLGARLAWPELSVTPTADLEALVLPMAGFGSVALGPELGLGFELPLGEHLGLRARAAGGVVVHPHGQPFGSILSRSGAASLGVFVAR